MRLGVEVAESVRTMRSSWLGVDDGRLCGESGLSIRNVVTKVTRESCDVWRRTSVVGLHVPRGREDVQVVRDERRADQHDVEQMCAKAMGTKRCIARSMLSGFRMRTRRSAKADKRMRVSVRVEGVVGRVAR